MSNEIVRSCFLFSGFLSLLRLGGDGGSRAPLSLLLSSGGGLAVGSLGDCLGGFLLAPLTRQMSLLGGRETVGAARASEHDGGNGENGRRSVLLDDCETRTVNDGFSEPPPVDCWLLWLALVHQ